MIILAPEYMCHSCILTELSVPATGTIPLLDGKFHIPLPRMQLARDTRSANVSSASAPFALDFNRNPL